MFPIPHVLVLAISRDITVGVPSKQRYSLATLGFGFETPLPRSEPPNGTIFSDVE